MDLPQRVRDWTPSQASANFLWHAGGWLAIGLIVVNTLLVFYAVTVQLRVLDVGPTGLEVGHLRELLGTEDVAAGLSAVERRQLLTAAKTYVISNEYPGGDFGLVFIRMVGDWALLEVVPSAEDVSEFRVLMQKVSGTWTGRAYGTSFAGWEVYAPAALFQ
jgi:hypothetical protein